MTSTRKWKSIRAGVVLATRSSKTAQDMVSYYALNRAAQRSYRIALSRDMARWQAGGRQPTHFYGRDWLQTSLDIENTLRVKLQRSA